MQRYFFSFYHYFNFIDEIQRGVVDGKEKSQLKINFVIFFSNFKLKACS